MIITKKALSRRTVLRGMGASLALPVLDAMFPAATAYAATTAKPVLRLGFVFMPMGATLSAWTPNTVGKLQELSPTLDSLKPFLDQLTVITNLELKNAYSAGNHATSNSSFLSAAKAKMTEGSDYQLGTTVDQVAAQHIGKDTRLPSLELAIDMLNTVGNCDDGYACVYQNDLSWSSPTTPLPAEAQPRVVFERMFGDGGSAAEREADLRRDGSILDLMMDDMARLKTQLGPGDRTKISQYLDNVRGVEQRIQKAERDSAHNPIPDMERPLDVPASYDAHVKLMFDLQLLALQSDTTRVLSFQLAREASTRTYTNVGITEAHHPLSHHGFDPVKLAKLAKINSYHVSLFAYFLDKLRSTPDGDGSLLDHSIYLYGSGMSNSHTHNHSNLPILVAGGRAFGVKGGQHIKYDSLTPLANLHLTLLEKAGVHLDSFADSRGRIAELS